MRWRLPLIMSLLLAAVSLLWLGIAPVMTAEHWPMASFVPSWLTAGGYPHDHNAHDHVHGVVAAQTNAAQDPAAHEHGPSGHAADEGLLLGPAAEDAPVPPGGRCPAEAPMRAFDLLAINVEITLNRYLDYDPQGRMYVLSDDLERVRAEEAQNEAARRGQAEPAVSVGLQGDAIQPLILRVNQGDCLQVTLHNELADGEAASFHLHGAGLVVLPSSAAAIASNPDSTAMPDDVVTVEWWVRPDQPEGTHTFHSYGNHREQTVHGLLER